MTRHRPRPRSQQSQWSRSFPPDTPSAPPSPDEQHFFEKPPSPVVPKTPEGGDTTDSQRLQIEPAFRERDQETCVSPERYDRPIPRGWRRDHEDVVLRHTEHRPTIGGSRIVSTTLDRILDNSNRRQFGMGWVGRVFG